MAYCEQADLAKLVTWEELAKLTAEAGDDIDAAVMSEAIAQADAEIDSYLAVRYALPLDSVPARVKALSASLSLYHLYARRGVAEGVWRQKYEDAVKFLRDVGAGRAEIIGATGAAPTGAESAVVELSSNEPAFTRSYLGGW
jgi:phage gp36-like protein